MVMKILGLCHGTKTAFDGQYLKVYDAERDGVSPEGYPMLAHIVTTSDINQAMRFESLHQLHAVWSKVCERMPIRPDGSKNRPLTAFSIEIVRC